jgi:hypothetical protein
LRRCFGVFLAFYNTLVSAVGHCVVISGNHTAILSATVARICAAYSYCCIVPWRLQPVSVQTLQSLPYITLDFVVRLAVLSKGLGSCYYMTILASAVTFMCHTQQRLLLAHASAAYMDW